MSKQYKINIVIPSYNSKNTIIQCLESIVNQSYNKPYKVIVIDSSDDGTNKIISKCFPSVHLIHLEDKTLPGQARNIGVCETSSEYIAFTDTDCIADYYWIEKMLTRMEQSGCDAMGGAILNGTPESISGTVGYLNEFSFFMPCMQSGLVTTIATANVCYKSNIFKAHQFIDSSFAGEDTVLHWTLLENNMFLVFDPETKVTHMNRIGLKNVLKHQLKIGQGAGFARIIMNRDPLLVEYPVLCILILPWIRLLRMISRIILHDKKMWKKMIYYFPLSLLIAYSWGIGFYQSIKRQPVGLPRISP